MHERSKLLSIIAQLVKQDPDPTSFPCNTRDIILHYGEWPDLLLKQLEEEGLIKIRRLERVFVFITNDGLELVAQMSNQIPG
jgi:hypothetical protein